MLAINRNGEVNPKRTSEHIARTFYIVEIYKFLHVCLQELFKISCKCQLCIFDMRNSTSWNSCKV